MTKTYNNKGVCSRSVTFDIAEDGTVTNVSFLGGCNGNLKAVPKLVKGMTVEQIEKTLGGITCGRRPTSCADQLTKAVRRAYEANP